MTKYIYISEALLVILALYMASLVFTSKVSAEDPQQAADYSKPALKNNDRVVMDGEKFYHLVKAFRITQKAIDGSGKSLKKENIPFYKTGRYTAYITATIDLAMLTGKICDVIPANQGAIYNTIAQYFEDNINLHRYASTILIIDAINIEYCTEEKKVIK